MSRLTEVTKEYKMLGMLAESQEAGDANAFIEFMLRHHVQNLEEAIYEYRESINDDTLNLGNDTINDTLNLSEKEQRVFDLIKADNNISIADIVERTGYSRPTITRAVSVLKERSLIARTGARKNGHWVVMVCSIL